MKTNSTNGKTALVKARASEATKKALARLAERRDESEAVLIREALLRYLHQHARPDGSN